MATQTSSVIPIPIREWRLRPADSATVQSLAREASVPEPIAQLLLARGLDTATAANAYLNPGLDQLHDPYLMLGMHAAVARIQQALANAEPILIYGDYDVDGTIATVLLKTALERLHARITPQDKLADIRYHIPHRLREGYGMQSTVLADAAATGIRLVISVDTGMRALAEADHAAALGLDLIVTDHHLPDDTDGLPRAIAVLNPNQPGCTYPTKSLCGAGVAFKLAQALLESAAQTEDESSRLREKTLPSFLKLLSIATIADCVPLTGENRAIVAIGLRELARPAQPGLQSLMDLAKLDRTRPLTSTDIAFRLAPRINAAGRMDVAGDVVSLFLTRDAAMGHMLAGKLHNLNEDRRNTEAVALTVIETRLETMRADGLPSCLVLDDPAWHRGVIGILASRVVERTGRPALILSHEDGVAHGSGRSISGFHLLDALGAAHHAEDGQLFTRFGGHAYAVGFSLPVANIPALRSQMARLAQVIDFADLPPLICDANLSFTDINDEFETWIARFAPIGHGNDEPVFISLGLTVASAPRLLKDMHLRLTLEDPVTGRRLSAIAWGRGEGWSPRLQHLSLQQGSRVDVVYRIRRNLHPDFGGLELEIADLRLYDL